MYYRQHLPIPRNDQLPTQCFFFFQAEAGIRDGRVTEVQTCALPISASAPTATGWPTRRWRPAAATARRWSSCGASRSEERRVGKEWRSRGSTYHLKKNTNAMTG